MAVGSSVLRKKLYFSVAKLFEHQDKAQVQFPCVVHETAIVSPTANMGVGCFVGPLALINTYAKLGDFCLVNSAALIEHDCVLKAFVTVNPGAAVMGGVVMESMSTLGANATVRDNRTIAAGATIGMGAAVVANIPSGPENGFWAGVPAKPFAKRGTGDASVFRIPWCIHKSFSVQRFHQYLQPSLAKGKLTNDGPLQNILQAKVRDLLRSKRQVLLCCNGTAALTPCGSASN